MKRIGYRAYEILAQRWSDMARRHTSRRVLGTAGGVVLVGVLIPILGFWHGFYGPLGPSIPLFFLIPVLLASIAGGRLAGVLVSVVAVLVWDWFFIPPLYTITIYYARDVLALVVFMVEAVLVGQLATTVRRRADEAVRRARSSEALYDLSMALIAGGDLTGALPALTRRLRETFNLEACAVLLPGTGTGWRTASAAGSIPPDLRADESRDVAAVASWVNDHGHPSTLQGERSHGRQTVRVVRSHGGSRQAQFVPLRVGARAVGVLELIRTTGVEVDPEQERLLATFANGAAIALEQTRLAQEERAATLARESDRLKSALLSSVSHDLRTPLAGIKAAASSLLQDDVQWSEHDRRAFAADIDAEADRLTRLVSNLLDLSRIEAGALTADKEWEDPVDLIDRVLRRFEARLAGHPIVRDVPRTLPAVPLDAVQMEQVLTNLIENAAKYSPSGTPIEMSARVVERRDGTGTLRIGVADRGVGIPSSEQGRIFDKFYRVAGAARYAPGTGMGLAISKGLVEANGGTITVQSVPGEGSTFTVSLPLAAARADAGGEGAAAAMPLTGKAPR